MKDSQGKTKNKGATHEKRVERALERIDNKIDAITKKEKIMAQTLADLQAAIAAVGTAVDADAAQDQLVIAAIEALIAKINANPSAADFTNEVAALSGAVATLTGSNASVQTEIDKASA